MPAMMGDTQEEVAAVAAALQRDMEEEGESD